MKPATQNDRVIYQAFHLPTLRQIATKVVRLKSFVNLSDYYKRPNYYISNARKTDLIDLLLYLPAVRVLQRVYRRKYIPLRVCPLTLEPIGTNPYFAKQLDEQKNNIMYYNAFALHEFMLVSGDFRDPISKSYYTNDELCTLDRLLGIKPKDPIRSVFFAKYNRGSDYRRQRVFEEECEIYYNLVIRLWRKLEDSLRSLGFWDDPAYYTALDAQYIYPMTTYMTSILMKSKSKYLETLKSLRLRAELLCKEFQNEKDGRLNYIHRLETNFQRWVNEQQQDQTMYDADPDVVFIPVMDLT